MESDGTATRIAIHHSQSPSHNPSHPLNSTATTSAPFPHPNPRSPAPSTTPAPPSLPGTPHVAASPLVSASAPSPQRSVKAEPDVKNEPGIKSETGLELGDLAPSELIASHQQPFAAGPSVRRKRKLDAAGYSPLEVAEIESRAAAIDYAVSLDQYDTIYASQSRFSSFEDAVDRLLPWHIWQVPEEELILPSKEKDAEDLAQSSAQVADLVNLRRRFAKVRRREGNHPSDLPSLIYMLRESTAQLREEFNTVQAAYRTAKSKHDAIVAEERKAREAAALKERLRREEIERQQRAQYIAQAQAQAQQAQRAAAAAAAAPPRPYQPPHTAPAQAPGPAYATAHAHPPSATVPPPRPVPPSTAPPASAAPYPPAPATGVPAPAYHAHAAPPAAIPPPAAVPASPVRPPAPAVQGTPIGVPHPAAVSTPASPSTPVRGRPRGRPRGSGRGGMRQATVTHAARPLGTPTATGSTPATPATGTKQAPVQITVAMTLIPAFVAASLLILPNPQNLKAPATIIRTSDDRKHVTLSIDLASCTQPQLQTLARLLNVQAKMPAAPGTPGSSAGANGAQSAPGGAAASPATPSTSAAPSSASSAPPPQATASAPAQAPPAPPQQ